MAREVKVFSELEIWMHKHAIHLAAVLILTGLIVSAQKLPSPLDTLFGWAAYALGTPAAYTAKVLGYSPFEQGYSAYSLGVQVARVLHRVAGVAMAFLGTIWLLGELPRIKRWRVWPEGGLGEAVRNLVDYYLRRGHPRFSKYNLGQKLWIWSVVVGFTLLFATGMIMWFRTSFSPGVVEAAHTLHVWLAWLGIAGLLVHVYLAVGIPEHRPMVRAMFRTGTAPEDYLREHHPLYLEKAKAEEE